MSDRGFHPEEKCSLCGITESAHKDLYATSLGTLNFSFTPDQGPPFDGTAHLCRPCTHDVLPTRLLEAAGVSEKILVAETWN